MAQSMQGAEGLRETLQLPQRVSSSAANVLRQRSDESWIELSSQPSSSSLSSSATDEIVSTGLRARQDSQARRRRRLAQRGRSRLSLRATSSGATSSQEEYEESESEEDRIMTVSNEGVMHDVPQLDLGPLPASTGVSTYDEENEEDDDENATALGVPSEEQVFTPQPNAFTHPLSSQSARDPLPDSYFAREPRSSSGPRHSYPSRRTPQHTPYNIISPSYQADHDAALRASLSTLLSCAAAARGLSKPARSSDAVARASPSGAQPPSFPIGPESMIMRPDSAGPPTPPSRGKTRSPSVASSDNAVVNEKAKRKAMSSPSKTSRERATKKTKSSLEDAVSPTLLTWVVSAGVVVIVSAISFSTGYTMGKEAGMAEAGLLDVGEGASCGKEAARGLRRFRWGPTAASSVRVS